MKDLPDIQSTKDRRGIALNRVGVSDVDFPIYIKNKKGEKKLCSSVVDMYVSLDHKTKGINMCYDDKTEILTKDRGWIFFKDLTMQDYVATLNIQTDELEFQNPTGTYIDDYKGKMYQYQNRLIDQCVTPNHNLLVYNSRNDKLHLEQAQKLIGRSFRFKKDCKWKGMDEPYILINAPTKGHKKKNNLHIRTIDFMKLLGYYLAEGCTAKAARGYSTQVIISQNSIQDLEKLKKIIGKYTIKASIQSNGVTGYKLCFVNKALGEFFAKLGKSPNRYIPNNIKSLSSKYLEVLFEWYMKGDGSKRENASCSVSKKLTDDLQEVCLKCGKSMNIAQYVKKQGFHPGVIEYRGYVLSQKLHPLSRPEGSKSSNEKWVDYQGKIYCCEVPNHTLMVRRNNKAAWSGNSRLPRTLMKYRYTSFSRWVLWKFLYDLKKSSESQDAYAEIAFKYFINKTAPVSKEESVMAYNCTYIGRIGQNNKYNFQLKVDVPITSCCPCSKEISKYGAHNQRGVITITAQTLRKRVIRLEDLIAMIEKAGSCELYPVLKRTDEKYVTEKAYDNPKFVEDIARDVAVLLQKLGTLKHFKVKVCNYESIHSHNAVCYIEREKKGKTWHKITKSLQRASS